MRILVTGGAGMVAQHVALLAVEAGHSVRLGDIRCPDLSPLLGTADAEWVRLDVRDRVMCARAASGCDAVIHCAALVGPARSRASPADAVAVNVDGTANLLEGSRSAGIRLVHVSTATLYGHRPDLLPLDETAAPDPLGIYDATKLMAETLCTAYRRTYGVDVASVRTGFVYGLGSAIGEYFLPKASRGEPVAEPAGADHPCDFTYVLDLAAGLLAMAAADRLPEPVYNMTGGRLRTRGELAAAVRVLIPEARIAQGPGLAPERHLRGPCMIERARRDFGYAPRYGLEEGLRDWLDHLRRAEAKGGGCRT